MRKTIWVLSVVVVLAVMNPAISEAQFRSERNTPTVTQKIGIPYSPSNSSLLLGLFDPSRLHMQQSYSVSFGSMGGQSGALGLYTNRLSYMISPKMMIIADIGYLHQPFQSSQGSAGPFGLGNGQLFYGGELRYRPTENTFLTIRLDNMPRSRYGYYNNDYYYGNRMYRDEMFPTWPYYSGN